MVRIGGKSSLSKQDGRSESAVRLRFSVDFKNVPVPELVRVSLTLLGPSVESVHGCLLVVRGVVSVDFLQGLN